MENNATLSKPDKRFRVYLIEKLHYTVDVLAKDEDEARELALEDETPRSEAECSYFDAEEVALLSEDDTTFNAGNACMSCGKRIEGEKYAHCDECKQVIKQSHGNAA